MLSFFNKIKNEELKTPTQHGFSLKKWELFWDSIKENATTSDRKIYESGKIFDAILRDIRSELEALYLEKAPNISSLDMLVSFISISNRDRAVLEKSFGEMNYSSDSSTLSNNDYNVDLSFQEISDGAVDCRAKAIFFCQQRINKSKEFNQGNDPTDIMSFLKAEVILSGLYEAYEGYWNSILWNDYDLLEVDAENKLYSVVQPLNAREISYEASQIRKQRLAAHSSSISMAPSILDFFKNDNYISILKQGRNKKLICSKIEKSKDDLEFFNSSYKTSYLDIIDTFGRDVLEKKHKLGFSVNDAIEVFRNLVLLSISFNKKYPEDDSAFNIKKLSEFCPKIDKQKLRIALKESTGLGVVKITKILNFIEYRAAVGQDLWCHPLFSISNNKYAFLTSALVTPVLLRVVEHWMVSLEINFQDKGLVFEKLVIDGINKTVLKNKLIFDYDPAVSKRIKLIDSQEEIDFLLRIGNVILVGESKSIVTTDSAISHYRTINTLEKAASQVKRKSTFVKNNISDVFDNLGWKYDSNIKYEFVECIINSGRINVGFMIGGVPVTDDKILTKYFKSELIPMISTTDEKGKTCHIAQALLYKDIDDLKGNLDLYLKNPPQLFSNKKFEHREAPLPSLNENSYKIIFKRLIPKDVKSHDQIIFDTPFEVLKSENYDNEIAKSHVLI